MQLKKNNLSLNLFLSSCVQTDALKCVAQASKNRSLADFEKVRVAFVLFFSIQIDRMVHICHTAPQ